MNQAQDSITGDRYVVPVYDTRSIKRALGKEGSSVLKGPRFEKSWS